MERKYSAGDEPQIISKQLLQFRPEDYKEQLMLLEQLNEMRLRQVNLSRDSSGTKVAEHLGAFPVPTQLQTESTEMQSDEYGHEPANRRPRIHSSHQVKWICVDGGATLQNQGNIAPARPLKKCVPCAQQKRYDTSHMAASQ